MGGENRLGGGEERCNRRKREVGAVIGRQPVRGSMRYIMYMPLVSVLVVVVLPALDLAVLDLGLERAVVTTVLGAVPGRQLEG